MTLAAHLTATAGSPAARGVITKFQVLDDSRSVWRLSPLS